MSAAASSYRLTVGAVAPADPAAVLLGLRAEHSVAADGHAVAVHADPPALVVAGRSVHNLMKREVGGRGQIFHSCAV